MNKLYCICLCLVGFILSCTPEEVLPEPHISLEINGETYEVDRPEIKRITYGIGSIRYELVGNIGYRYEIYVTFTAPQEDIDGACLDVQDFSTDNQKLIGIGLHVLIPHEVPRDLKERELRRFNTEAALGTVTACNYGKKKGTRIDATFEGLLLDQVGTELEIKNGVIRNMPFKISN